MSKDRFIMKPKVDFCFKALMECAEVRNCFIAALLKVKVEDIQETQLLPTIMEKETVDGKAGILDVRVLMKSGAQMDMEMQLDPFELWPERSLFYWSRMFISQIREGDTYGELKKCIHVGILNFMLFPEEQDYYSCFHLWEDQRECRYTDKAEFHILELPKLEKYGYPEDELLRWARFLNAEQREEFEEMAKEDTGINKAYERLMKLSADEKKRLEYEAREKAIRDYNWQMSSSFRKGEEQGKKEGREEGRKEGRKEGKMEGREIEAARYNQLISRMIGDGRVEELERAAKDPAYKEKLFKEYGLDTPDEKETEGNWNGK